MTRKRRDTTTADQVQLGDVIEPNNNGYRAVVEWLFESENITEPHVGIHWTYPNDFSVNASHRGQASGRILRPGDPLARWLEPR